MYILSVKGVIFHQDNERHTVRQAEVGAELMQRIQAFHAIAHPNKETGMRILASEVADYLRMCRFEPDDFTIIFREHDVTGYTFWLTGGCEIEFRIPKELA